MSLADWAALALVCLAGAMSPGPSLFLVLRHASLSPAAGLRCAAAHGLGVGLLAALAVSGLGALLLVQPKLLGALSVLGGAWLLWLAVGAWRAAPTLDLAAGEGAQAGREGLLMALANPKVLLFFAAIFTRFLPANAGPVTLGGMAALALLIDGLWYAVVALAWHHSGVAALLRRRLRWFNRLGALIFASVGVSLIISGWRP